VGGEDVTDEGDDRVAPVEQETGSRLLDRFDVLLWLTVPCLVVLSLVDTSQALTDAGALTGALVVTTLLGATMVVALRASGLERRRRRGWEIAIVLTVAAVLVLLLTHLVVLDEPIVVDAGNSPQLFWLVLTAAAPVVVVRRLLQHERVTRQTLFGALSGYLLIAIALSFVFRAITVFEGIPFFGSAEPTTTYIYFSLVTMTTVGYGDFAAVTQFGRLASGLGALLGQVYLVTVVAMVVGLLAQRRGQA
jgi:hypothetical protein